MFRVKKTALFFLNIFFSKFDIWYLNCKARIFRIKKYIFKRGVARTGFKQSKTNLKLSQIVLKIVDAVLNFVGTALNSKACSKIRWK